MVVIVMLLKFLPLVAHGFNHEWAGLVRLLVVEVKPPWPCHERGFIDPSRT